MKASDSSATGQLLGHECRTKFDAVFTAATVDHAMDYAWPSNFLLDNLYYGLMLELEIDNSKVLQEHRGEVLVKPDGVILRGVYLLENLSIAQGRAKNPQWNPALEYLPAALMQERGKLLKAHPLRRDNWWQEV